jgi:hypothetical protein
MTDEELIGYCDLHSRTERGLFSAEQINRMVALAGLSEKVQRVPDGAWIALWDDMQILCDMAREAKSAAP